MRIGIGKLLIIEMYVLELLVSEFLLNLLHFRYYSKQKKILLLLLNLHKKKETKKN